MKFLAALTLLVTVTQTLTAQPGAAVNRPVRSVSGQFMVMDARPTPGPGEASGFGTTNPNLLALEPAFLAVSCERIKQALYATLGVTAHSRGMIYITIRPTRGREGNLPYSTERFGDNWIYRLELPPLVERRALVRVIVQMVLQEMANRTATNHLPEIPAWLVEGLTEQLLGSREVEIVLAPPSQSIGSLLLGATNIQARLRDPLEVARRVLSERPPLSLAELSWPTTDPDDEDAKATFRCSSQVFVIELLSLQPGRECLRAMINDLAGCYNWQTAFLRAFSPHFADQLAVEKWWTLQVVHFVGRDPTHLWTVAESWQKLTEVMRTGVSVRQTRTEMPAHTDASLQAIIREWPPTRQTPTLRGKIRELEMARLRVAPEFMGLVDDYYRVLTRYLEQRERAASTIGKLWLFTPGAEKVVREAVQQLDELDRRRAALQPNFTRPSRSPATAAIRTGQ